MADVICCNSVDIIHLGGGDALGTILDIDDEVLTAAQEIGRHKGIRGEGQILRSVGQQLNVLWPSRTEPGWGPAPGGLATVD